MRNNSLVFIILCLKTFINKIRNCIFKKTVSAANNKNNFNNNQKNCDKNQLFNWR